MQNTKEQSKDKVNNKPVFQLKALGRNMIQLAELEAQVNKEEVDKELVQNARLTAAGLFRIVVMGEIKKGKSSFINALLGHHGLVPVHSNVATSTIFKIHYGEKTKYTVYYKDEMKKSPLVIDVSELHAYGTEDGNPKNVKNVDFIRVEAKSPLLKTGVVLVDTPGVGGLFKEHREITYRHAPNADAIFFLTDSVESPIGEDEVKFLKDLRQATDLITFIQTKSSQADSEARKARMSNNISIIENEVGIAKKDISYFTVDSKLKSIADRANDMDDLEDSGFLPLMDYLNDSLRAKKEIYVARSATIKSFTRISKLSSELEVQRQILDADSEESRQKLLEEISDVQNKLNDWEQNKRPQLMKELRNGLVEIKRNVDKELLPLQSGGEIERRYTAKIDRCDDVEQVQTILKDLEGNIASLASQLYLNLSKEANDRAVVLLTNISNNFMNGLNPKTPGSILDIKKNTDIHVSAEMIRRTSKKDMEKTIFEDSRNLFFGGMAGLAIGGIAGGIIGSIVPGVGTVVGAFVGKTIGGLWGVKGTIDSTKITTLENFKRESVVGTERTLSSARQNIKMKVNELIEDLSRSSSDQVELLVKDASKTLLEQRNDVTQRQKATQIELVQAKKKFQLHSVAVQQVKKNFESFAASIPNL